MKKLGYCLFAMMYYVCCLFPRKKQKVFGIMTHDCSKNSNVGVVVEKMRSEGNYQIHLLKKDERDHITKQGKIKSLLHFFFVHPFHLATSMIVLQDNVFLPMAYIKFPKKVKVVQLWHGTGTIKKFGQTANSGELLKLEKSADATITHLIVNGKATREIYREAFGVTEEKVYEIGLPRTDLLFHKKICEQKKDAFYKKYPKLNGKKLILYAPTFRDHEVEHPKIAFDVNQVVAELPSDYVLGVRLHPFVAKSFQGIQLTENVKARVYDFSMEEDLNQLLLASDVLVTDYSSIIFEYCLLKRPMIFYAYDYKDFKEEQRGFYEPYESFVPGKIAYTQEELIGYLKNEENDLNRIEKFIKEQYRYTDGNATNRLMKLLDD